jgi:hypothetical protein
MSHLEEGSFWACIDTNSDQTAYHPMATLYYLCTNDTRQTPGTYLAHFLEDTCSNATDSQQSYVVRATARSHVNTVAMLILVH